MSRRRLPLAGYLTAQAVSTAGTRVSMVALPWLVLTTTGSASLTGLVAAAEMLPLVTLQALSGPYVDRLGARRVAVTCDALSVLVVGAVPVLHRAGALSLPLLLALVAVAGSLRGPSEVARSAMVPVLVRQTGVATTRVTGLGGAVERTASMTGAALGAALVAAVGAANALLVDAASFGVGAVLLVVLTRPGELETSPREPYLAELRSGWDFMRGDAVLMGIGVMVAVTNLIDQGFTAVLLPVWARDSGRGIAAVGLVGATFAAAAIAGSSVAAVLAHRMRRYWTFLVCFLLAGAPRYLVLALDGPLWTVVAVCVLGGFASGFLNPILGAVLFERTPPALVGRVSAMNLAMAWSLMPVGGLAAGLLVAGLGGPPALAVAGAAYLLTTLLPAVQPRWRDLDRPALMAEATEAAETAETAQPALGTSPATKSSLSSTGAGMTKG